MEDRNESPALTPPEKLNLYLNIVLKGCTSAAILALLFFGNNFYQDYRHQGPDCAKQKQTIQNWLKDEIEDDKLRVISNHKGRLQTSNGTTECYGYLKLADGKYRSWTSTVVDTDTGIIGRVSVDM